MKEDTRRCESSLIFCAMAAFLASWNRTRGSHQSLRSHLKVSSMTHFAFTHALPDEPLSAVFRLDLVVFVFTRARPTPPTFGATFFVLGLFSARAATALTCGRGGRRDARSRSGPLLSGPDRGRLSRKRRARLARSGVDTATPAALRRLERRRRRPRTLQGSGSDAFSRRKETFLPGGFVILAAFGDRRALCGRAESGRVGRGRHV